MIRKIIKYFNRTIVGLLLFAVVFIISAYIIVQNPRFQTWAAHKAAEWLSEKTKTKVHVGSVNIKFFNRLSIEDVYIEDLNKDTLAFIRNLDTRLTYFNPFNNKYYFRDLNLEGVRAYLHRKDGDSTFNYQFLIDAFASKKATNVSKDSTQKKEPSNIELKVDKISLKNIAFVLDDEEGGQGHFAQLESLTLHVKDIDLPSKSVYVKKLHLTSPDYTLVTYKHKNDTTTHPPFNVNLGWKIVADDLRINNGHFGMHDKTKTRSYSKNGFEFTWFDVNEIQLQATNYQWDSTMSVNIDLLSAVSKENKVDLHHISGIASLKNTGIAVKNLEVAYNNTSLNADASLTFNDFGDFNDFLTKVYIKADIQNAETNGADVGVWAKAAQEFVPKVKLSGKVEGTISHLIAENLKLSAGQKTFIAADASIKGLPDPQKMWIEADVKSLFTHPNDLKSIIPYVKLPQQINLLGATSFTGNFRGYYNDFRAKGKATAQPGVLLVDLSMNLRNMKAPVYKGNITSPGLRLPEITGVKNLGNVAFNLNLDGRGFDLNSLKTNLEGEITQFDFNGYRFETIHVAGLIDQKVFKGHIDIEDDCIGLDFDGDVDINDLKNPSFAFHAKVEKADLQVLGLIKNKLIVSVEGDFKFTGSSVNNLCGTATLNDIALQNNQLDIQLSDIFVSLDNAENYYKEYKIQSQDINAHIKGNFDPTNIHVSILKYLSERSTLINAPTPEELAKVIAPQQVSLEIGIVRDFGIFPLLDTNIKSVDDIQLTGNFIAADNYLDLNITTDSVNYSNILFKGFNANVSEKQGTLFGDVRLNELVVSKIPIRDIQIESSTNLNMLNALIKAEDDSSANNLRLVTRTSFSKGNTLIEVLQSDIKINKKDWKISEGNAIQFADSNIYIKNFTLLQDNQSLKIENVPNNPKDARLRLKNFDLADIVKIVDTSGIVQSGLLSGVVTLKNPQSALEVEGDISIENLKVYDLQVDLLGIDAKLVEKNTKLLVGGFLADDEFDLQFNGSYSLAKENKNPLDIDVIFDKLNLGFLAFPQILGNEISNLKASARGNLKVSGSPSAPALNGDATIIDTASVKVNFLGTTLRFANEDIALRPGSIEFYKKGMLDKSITIIDEYNNRASLKAKIEHNYFKNWTINAAIITDKFNFLKTTYKDNNDFFGTVFASGAVEIAGPVENLNMNITAKSLANTDFNLVTSSSGDANVYDFVKFVNRTSPDPTMNIKEKTARSSNINITMNLEVTPDAYFKMYLDYAKNDVIRARGNANLTLTLINGNINLTGNYEATSGDYLFSQQDILNKNFLIKNGSTIRWSGDIMNADMNVEAYYSTKASVKNIVDSTSTLRNARVPMDVVIGMNGKLSQPDIKFKLEPTPSLTSSVPEEIKAKLLSMSQDQNEINKQAFAVLIMGSFFPSSGLSSSSGSVFTPDAAVTSVTDFFNAKISEYFNEALSMLIPGTEVNFRQGIDNTGITLTKKLSNDRLVLNIGGNVQYGQNRANVQTSNAGLVGDVEIQYMITEDGRVKIKAYSRYDNTYIRIDNSTNVRTGVGIEYQKEFDRLDQLFKVENKRKKKAPSPPTDSLKNKTNPPPPLL